MKNKLDPIFKIANVVSKVEAMKVIMADMVEYMDNYDFFEDEELKANDVINAIRTGSKVVRHYVVDTIVGQAYDCDRLLEELLTYDEAMTIAKYLIMSEED